MAYVNSPIPNAGVYGEMSALALNAWNAAKSQLRAKQGQIFQQYGFEGDFDDETGQAKNVRVSAANPYGSYQKMLHSQGGELDEADEEAQQRGLNEMKGLGAQRGSRARFNHGAAMAEWGRNFASDSAGVSSQWQSAGFDYQAALLAAQRAAMQDAIANRQFNEAPTQAPAAPAVVSPGGNPTTMAQLAAQQQLIQRLAQGSSINEATRMAAQIPRPPARPSSPNLWFK